FTTGSSDGARWPGASYVNGLPRVLHTARYWDSPAFGAERESTAFAASSALILMRSQRRFLGTGHCFVFTAARRSSLESIGPCRLSKTNSNHSGSLTARTNSSSLSGQWSANRVAGIQPRDSSALLWQQLGHSR